MGLRPALQALSTKVVQALSAGTAKLLGLIPVDDWLWMRWLALIVQPLEGSRCKKIQWNSCGAARILRGAMPPMSRTCTNPT